MTEPIEKQYDQNRPDMAMVWLWLCEAADHAEWLKEQPKP